MDKTPLHEVSTNALLDWGRTVLEEEGIALQKAAAALSEDFPAVIQAILGIPGKVVLTGLGKSGHIARKTAATLASTGTPAFFVHPSEAQHGDLGMIGSGDFLLAIAYGGETTEVVEVAAFCRRIGVPVAAITGQKTSALAGLADYLLDGAVSREACPNNLAPTSSSTVALALGDAVAVALMRARGFREEDFASFHPKGSLGRRLARVSDHMHTLEETPVATRDMDFHQVLELVTRHNFGIVAVAEDGSLVGAITDGDLRRAMLKLEAGVFSRTAGQLMTAGPRTIQPGAPAVDAVRLMEENKITSLFVCDQSDQSRLLGLVRMHDLLAAKIL